MKKRRNYYSFYLFLKKNEFKKSKNFDPFYFKH